MLGYLVSTSKEVLNKLIFFDIIISSIVNYYKLIPYMFCIKSNSFV